MDSWQSSKKPPVVMMVDDDDMTRMMATEYLTQAGFSVVEARDGGEALDRINQCEPDIVLLDVEMPVLDGYATCVGIRTLPRYRSIPILMLTGLEDATSINLAYEAGATDFATKPINWLLLCHRLRYMLRSSAVLDELENHKISLASAQRIAALGNWEWTIESDRLIWSEQLYRILDLPTGTTRPSFDTFLQRVHVEDRKRVGDWFEALKDPSTETFIDHRIVVDDGSERNLRQQFELERNADGMVHRIQTAVQDVTERYRAERKIHQLAYFDSLTALPNRALFAERLDQALTLAKRHSRSMAVMFLDLDDFKRVNDTLGHACGDILLKNVAERLQKSVRDSDSVARDGADGSGETIARMGGDEFTVLLADLRHVNDATVVATRFVESLCEPHDLAGTEVFTTSSIGIAVYPRDGETAETLVKNADMAMYFAKREGKNLFRVYDESMNESSMLAFTMDSQLRRALENNELSIHYQPQMNLENGKLDAVEALLRWNNPLLGSVSPIDFIPLAEETGLIVPIGEWVLRTACAQVKAWQLDELPLLRVAVNISVLQFVRPDFPELIEDILQSSGLDANVLELEITESVLAKDNFGAVAMLKRLKKIGVQLSIDDFGTGYSSLSQLKHFPIDRLKIDQSFVHGVISNSHDAAITQAVLAMASSMELRVVAEGVETLEQLQFLRAKHCDEAQGYLLGRPLPPEELEAMMRESDLSARTGTDG